jgi:Tfp pilus assembly protein PilO
VNRSHWIAIGCFVAAFVAISYLGWALMIRPVEKNIQDTLAERDDVQKKLTDAKTKAAQFDKFRAQAENIRRDLNLISLRLAPDLSVREQNRIMARIASESSLRVTNVTLDPRTRSKEAGFSNLDSLVITITFSGGFHELGNFINSVIAGQRMMVPSLMVLGPVADVTMIHYTTSGTLTLLLFLDQAGAGK